MMVKTWERSGYVVNMLDFDHDLKVFKVVQEEVDNVQIIYPSTIEDMELIIQDLNNGEDVNGWEDGNGNVIVINKKF